MSSPPTHPDQPTRRLGAGMIVAAWVLVLGLFVLFFGGWLDRQHNPNRHLEERAGADGAQEVVLLRNRAGHYVASGRIDGHPVRFLLDTGATTVSIPGAMARRLGLRPGPAQIASTAAGEVTTYRTRLHEVELGGIQLRDVAANINPRMEGEEALLGMSFLKHLELTQRGNQLTLRQYP